MPMGWKTKNRGKLRSENRVSASFRNLGLLRDWKTCTDPVSRCFEKRGAYLATEELRGNLFGVMGEED
jgi:hypothetical protein